MVDRKDDEGCLSCVFMVAVIVLVMWIFMSVDANSRARIYRLEKKVDQMTIEPTLIIRAQDSPEYKVVPIEDVAP